MHLPAQIRNVIALTLLLVTPSAFADFGPDAGDLVLALLAWLPFVGISIWVAPVHRRWVAGAAALLAYPYAWIAFVAFAQRIVDDHYAASRAALWAMLAASSLFIAWLLLLRLFGRRAAKDSPTALMLDFAAVLLVVPALAVAIAPLELMPMPLDNWKPYSAIIAPVVVFTCLLGAYGLHRRWFWAWWLAAVVALLRLLAEAIRLAKLPALFQIGAHGGEAQIGMLLLMLPVLIVVQLGVVGINVVLGGLLLHPFVRGVAAFHAATTNAAKFNLRKGDFVALLAIVVITVAATPKVRYMSTLLVQNAIYQQQLRKNEHIRRENIADMNHRAAAEAAAAFDALPRQDKLPLMTLSAKDVSAFVATTASADCDVRIWHPDDTDGWNRPRVVWRLTMIDVNDIRLKLDVVALARRSDGIELRYAEREQHFPPRAAEMDAIRRVIEVRHEAVRNATDLEHGSSLLLMLGAEPVLGKAAANKGHDFEHSEVRHVVAYGTSFFPAWSQEDRALFQQQGEFAFELVSDDLRIEQPQEWREWIIVRSDDSILVSANDPPGFEARLVDASQMPALRKLMPPNYYGISEGGAQIRLAGMHRLNAIITDLNLQKRQIALLQEKMLDSRLTVRMKDNAGDIRDANASADGYEAIRTIHTTYREAPALQIAAACTGGAPVHLRTAVQQLTTPP